MDPGEKHDRPSDELVERDILVELDDAIQGRLSC